VAKSSDGSFEPAGEEATTRTPHLLQVIWQRKSLVMLGLFLGLALGVVAYLSRSPVYQSSAQVLVIKKRPEMITGANAQAMYYDDYMSTQLTLIRSQAVLTRAVDWLKDTGGPADAGRVYTVGQLQLGLAAGRDKDANNSASNIVNLTFRGPAPEECPKVLDAVFQGYRNFLTETYKSINKQTIQMFRQAEDIQKTKLEKAKKDYAEWLSKNNLLAARAGSLPGLQLRIGVQEGKRADLLQRQSELQSRRQLVERALADGQSKAQVLAMLDKTALPRGSTQPEEIRAAETAQVNLRLQLEEVEQTLGKDHPQIISLKKRLGTLVEQTKRGAGDYGPLDPLEIQLRAFTYEYDMNKEVLKQLDAVLVDEKKEAENLSKYVKEEEEAKAQIEDARKLYNEVLKKLEQMDLTPESEGYNAEAITPPGPGIKVAPNLLTTLLLAAVLGILGGTGLAYLADLTDKSFRDPDDIRRTLGLAVVGHVPYLTAAEEAGEGDPDPMLCAYYRPKSVEAEAFRGVRTALYFSTMGKGHQVIQLTSPNKADGKSTVIANLAVSIAQSGKRVLLMDADFRRPRQHQIFRVENPQVGLATVMAGELSIPQAVRTTQVPGLFLLPCGPRPANPAELLTSPRFLELIAEARADYEYVLIDTPPVLAVSDPCVVAPHVDGVILTIRATKNNQPAALRAKDALVTLGANVVGVIVNGFDEAGPGGPHAYGYAYSYEYSAYAEEGESDSPAVAKSR
jgi:capsular exopolysaccharide synthesis family protein